MTDAKEVTGHSGTKSYLALMGSAVIAPWLIKNLGVEVAPDQQLQIVAAAVAVVGGVMRTVSSGPPLAGLRRIFARKPEPLRLAPEAAALLVRHMAPVLVTLVEKIIDRREAAKSSTARTDKGSES